MAARSKARITCAELNGVAESVISRAGRREAGDALRDVPCIHETIAISSARGVEVLVLLWFALYLLSTHIPIS